MFEHEAHTQQAARESRESKARSADKRAAKLAAKYLERIKADTLSESDIRALRRHLVDRFNTPAKLGAFAETIEGAISARPPRIMPDQSAKGIGWLRHQHKTPAGRVRRRSPFNAAQVAVLDSFSHFTLTGFYDVGQRESYLLPVYRVHSTSGDSFAYMAGAWQSGTGGIEFL